MWTLAFGYHEDRTPTHGYARVVGVFGVANLARDLGDRRALRWPGGFDPPEQLPMHWMTRCN